MTNFSALLTICGCSLAACAATIKQKAILTVEVAGKDVGEIHLKLFNNTPKTSANFLGICGGKNPHNDSYNNVPFHRIIPGFMAQGGDTTRGDGTGGRSIYGEKFADENFENSHDSPGLLSMANAGPNTNGAQFFITFKPTSWLDGHHVVFGCVSKGLDVLKQLEALGSPSGSPSKKVTIKQCKIEEATESECEKASSTTTEL